MAANFHVFLGHSFTIWSIRAAKNELLLYASADSYGWWAGHRCKLCVITNSSNRSSVGEKAELCFLECPGDILIYVFFWFWLQALIKIYILIYFILISESLGLFTAFHILIFPYLWWCHSNYLIQLWINPTFHYC